MHALQPSAPRNERLELLLLLEERERRARENKLATYRPYAKQREFHAKGNYRERLLRAGNQNGKTFCCGAEVAYHLTGRYPPWWEGRRWDRPILAWASSETGESTRDNPQRALLGMVGELGTGAIPKEHLGAYGMAMGVSNLFDFIKVRHVSGGWSTLRFKNYAQGRRKWQGPPVDFVWFDEEPPADIYDEGLARTIATGGCAAMTFTPLQGMSEVVRRFLVTPSADQSDTNMTIEDAEHIPPEERARIIASFPAHEREARAKGIPTLGSGRIYPVTEESIRVHAFPVPAHWPRICGIDFGWDHPFAAAWLAWDRDTDTVYVTDCYREREATPVIHAASIKPRGDWIPIAWPHDGLNSEKGSGEPLAEQYRSQGLPMLGERATFEDGSNGVEAGLMAILERMQTGRFKVFDHLHDWFEEFRLYHRKDGKVVKEADDIMSATRYGVMMLRHAITKPVKRAPPRAIGAGGWMG
jgi:phage terminase large subunit-like protein